MAGDMGIGAHYMVPRSRMLRLQTALPDCPQTAMKHDTTSPAANSKTAPRARD